MGNHDQSLRLSKKKKIGRHISRVLMIVFAAVVVISVIFAMVQSRFNGVYFMPGYGMSLRARFGFVTVYQTTDSYYCKDSDYSGIIIGNTLYSGMGRFGVEIEGDLLRLKDAGAQYTYDLQREKDSFLKNKSKVDASRPEEAFHMYYEMLRENYAFFDLYGVNPEARYDRIWSRLSNQETTLIEAMKDLVDEVYDGHIGIAYRDQEYSPAGESPEWITDKEQLGVLSDLITTVYVSEYKKFEDVYIRYGYLSEHTGYIAMHAMGMESFNKSKTTKEAMDTIMADYAEKGTSSVVIDLRFNGGGYDEASLCIAGYFAQEPYLAYQKQAYYKGDYTALQSMYVEPADYVFNQDVYVLTSPYTISAAETFLRAMLAHPSHRVTVVGETTAGCYSDAFERVLPFDDADIRYTFSNERYFDAQGNALEGCGIVPDVLIPVSVESARKGHDDALDYVMAEIEARR